MENAIINLTFSTCSVYEIPDDIPVTVFVKVLCKVALNKLRLKIGFIKLLIKRTEEKSNINYV